MTPATTADINTPVAIDVIEPHATSETNPPPPLTPAYLIVLQYVRHIFDLPARGGPALRHVYRQYLQRVIMPQSTPAFIISCLMDLLQIKSQAQHTNLLLLRISVISLVIYGFASAVEPAVPPLDRTSVYARWAMIGCLCILALVISYLICF